MSFTFPPLDDDESDEDTKARTVRATDIVDWLADPAHAGQPLTVQNALVDG